MQPAFAACTAWCRLHDPSTGEILVQQLHGLFTDFARTAGLHVQCIAVSHVCWCMVQGPCCNQAVAVLHCNLARVACCMMQPVIQRLSSQYAQSSLPSVCALQSPIGWGRSMTEAFKIRHLPPEETLDEGTVLSEDLAQAGVDAAVSAVQAAVLGETPRTTPCTV